MNKLIFLGILLAIIGCSPQGQKSESSDKKLYVVATTGMLYDAAINIGRDKIRAEAIMGPGVDPHLYKATQGDLSKLNNADLIIYNGLALEGKMGEILEKLGRRKPVVAAAENIPRNQLLGAIGYQNAYDPHIWFDVQLWKSAVSEIEKALVQADSVNAGFYQENARLYQSELDSLHEMVKSRITEIPEKQRILVTAHDAFQYFGRAYGIRVEGLQGISTVADIGLRDIARVIDIIIENDIRAIFIETSVSEKTVNAVIEGCREKGHEVKVGGALFSDAMGELGTYEGTYEGMVTTNVNTIVKGLAE